MKRSIGAWSVILLALMLIVVSSRYISGTGNQIVRGDNSKPVPQMADFSTQLNAMESAYAHTRSDCPRYFADVAELKVWLAKDATNELLSQPTTVEGQYLLAEQMQKTAYGDGFIIYIDQEFVCGYFYTYGLAFINGAIWAWQIQTDDIYCPKYWAT